MGLLCGRGTKEVKTVLVALDPFESVCQEAVQMGADLLLTHHPLIFQPLSAVNDQTTVGRAVLQLISHDIAAATQYASHILHLHHKPLFFGTKEEYISSDISRSFLGGEDK